jgi:hypothetical protein
VLESESESRYLVVETTQWSAKHKERNKHSGKAKKKAN